MAIHPARTPWSHERYIQELEKIGSKVIPLEPYVNMQTKIKHQCECGNIYKVVPMSVRNGRKCLECGKKNLLVKQKPKTHEQYLEDIKFLDITPLESYVKNDIKIDHRCNCGEIFKQSPKKIIEGFIRCKKCHKVSEGFHGKPFLSR